MEYSLSNRLHKFVLRFCCLLVILFQFHHPVLVPATAFPARLLICLLFCNAATAGLFVVISHSYINQLSLAIMQVYRGAGRAAQVNKSQYENEELLHALQK